MNLGPNTAFAKPCPYTQDKLPKSTLSPRLSRTVFPTSRSSCRHASAGNVYRPYFWNSQSLLSSGQT